ncbi:RND family efflux transporter, MFP subunit [Hyella patelloides LEGE 07179]|uniref:RND family efflux transporter, MFP subunit n=1 Tax=Hyella patelloides LEGE 07179 TaxID=945734 RepID=A0A563VUL1_9CYAN|nr:efflux RND transporter periplasmic adaptor subunit [Hyella patelloides]VEP14961.1 RND family efflux transporter, MFP subunit [Hyella patelloides LEGE 07179]
MEFSTTSKKRRFPLWGIGLITGGLILIGASTTYVITQRNNSQTQIEELTETVVQENLAVRIRASGRVEPIKNVNVSPKNPGRLIRLLVEQGDLVSQGQTLAIMENTEVAAQKAEAEAQLQQAIASLEQNQVTIQGNTNQAQARFAQAKAQLQAIKARIPKEISQAEAQLQSAQSRLNLTAERIKRNRYLLERGAISQDEFDEAVNENSNAQANLKEIEERLVQLKTTESPEIAQLEAQVTEAQIDLQQKQNSSQNEIAAFKAQVTAAQASLQQIEIQYSDTVVTAPFDGTVTQRYAVEGSFVTPTTSASTSASASATSIVALAQGLEIIAKVPEVDISQLREGQKVEIVADAYSEEVFEGEVKRIAPEAIVEDNVTSFEVRISLVTGEDKLRSKMNVDVTFIGQELNNSLVVPTVAIVTEKGETGVMKLNDKGQPEFTPVTIGLTIKDKTQVLEGITSEDRVFIDLPEERRN